MTWGDPGCNTLTTVALSPVSRHSLETLKSPALEIPKRRGRREFGSFLESAFSDFFEQLQEFDGPLGDLIDVRKDRIRQLAQSILDAWSCWRGHDVDGALSRLDEGLGVVRDELTAMSNRQAMILPDQCWYRLAAWEGVSRREHVFHTPFELPQSSYRFSTTGRPSLYLANSVYLCWIECGRPRFDRCFVSRFEIDTAGFELLNLPVGSAAAASPLDRPALPGIDFDPRHVMNSPYRDDIAAELVEYLTLWPLLAAITTRKHRRAEGTPPEYVIPQLLMLWVSQSDRFLGIRYLTSKPDYSTNSNDWSINLALPSRRVRPRGYCDFLRSHTRCTEPQPLAGMRRLSARELATPSAVDERERRSGRVMLIRGRSMFDYIETPFGKMEYWLDRPELELLPI
jgi:hypothetical protein